MNRAVLLDVDGTLIDTNLLHVLSWSRAFRRLGHEIDSNRLLHAVGMGGDQLVPAVLGDDTQGDEARKLHSQAYVDAGLIEHAEALPGAADLLAALRKRGVRTALASSAKAKELERYLKLLGGGREIVDVIVTGDDVTETKPAPHIFAIALERLGHPEKALVVGDTVYDVEAAKKLGLPTIGLLSGGIERKVLHQGGAAAIYDNAAALAADLDRALAIL